MITGIIRIARITGIIRTIRITGITRITNVIMITGITRITGIVRITRIIRIIRISVITGIIRITRTEAVPLRATTRGTRPETGSAGRSVDWSDTTMDQPAEEAILQISGAGHWFLEGWIGDHAVDFLVDSGSAATALSCTFYQTLLRAGAPVGALQPTDRRLRGANGSPITISGCSSCMVSFLGLRTEFPVLGV